MKYTIQYITNKCLKEILCTCFVFLATLFPVVAQERISVRPEECSNVAAVDKTGVMEFDKTEIVLAERGFEVKSKNVLADVSGEMNGEGERLLEAVSAAIKAGSITKFTFTATDAKGKQVYNESGSIWIFGNKFRLEMPDELMVVSDGVTRWIYKMQSEEIIVSESDPENTDIMENPFAIFDVAGKGYTILPAVQAGYRQGKTVKIIILKAKDAVTNYRQIHIAVEGNNIPAELVFNSTNGAKYTVQVNRFSKAENLAAQTFAFSVRQYPNAVVTDLR